MISFITHLFRFVNMTIVEYAQSAINFVYYLPLAVNVTIIGSAFLFLSSSLSCSVSCMKDFHYFCKCPPSKKFLMSTYLPLLPLHLCAPHPSFLSSDWATRDEIRHMLLEMRELINLHKYRNMTNTIGEKRRML